MYFTEKALKDLAREYESIPRKHAALMEAYLKREYRENRGKEFAQHGFLRRVKSMARSITNVFTLLPPERADIPSSEERHEAGARRELPLRDVWDANLGRLHQGRRQGWADGRSTDGDRG